MLSRKDTSQDLDRPHFYSQFWIDVAQGKRDLSAVRGVDPDAEAEDIEEEDFGMPPEPVVSSLPKPKAAPKAPEKKPEPPRPVISSLADLANIDLLMRSSAEMDSDEVPDIEAGAIDDLGPFAEAAASTEPAIVTDFDLDAAEKEPAELLEESLDDDDVDFDEEEEDDWGSPRKSSKPQKPRRQPRERRGF
jgi:hypothetical protein